MADAESLQPAGRSAAPLAEAVDAFLADTTPAAGYSHVRVGGYRALCRYRVGGPLRPGEAELVLLAGSDGAVYLGGEGDHEPVADMLRQRRLHPTGSTLALRLPPELGGSERATGMFALWASPRYLAARGREEQIWK